MPETDITPLYGSSDSFTGEVAHLLEDDEVDAILAADPGGDFTVAYVDEEDDEEEEDEQ